MTGPGKTGLIYTKYTCLYYGNYISCSVYAIYPKSVSFIEFLMDFCIYNDILDTIWITDNILLHFNRSKSSPILRVVCVVDKTAWFSQARLHIKKLYI